MKNKPSENVIVSEINGEFIAIAKDQKGAVIANSYPGKNPQEAIERISYDVEVLEVDMTKNEPMAKAIYDIWKGKKTDISWIPISKSFYSPKEVAVLEVVKKIPRGETRSYGEVAFEAGLPQAARFVGNTMASNRLPLLVPCHRVIRSDGRVGQYGGPGGEMIKYKLLQKEGAKIRL